MKGSFSFSLCDSIASLLCVLDVFVENQFPVDAGFISGLPVVIRQCVHSDAGTHAVLISMAL